MKKKNSFLQCTFPAMEACFRDDGVDKEPEILLRLTIVGEGKSKVAQFVDLLKRMGLERAYQICRKRQIYGVKTDEQLLVDVKCGRRKGYYRREKENGKEYYIFVQTDTKTKVGQLKKLSARSDV